MSAPSSLESLSRAFGIRFQIAWLSRLRRPHRASRARARPGAGREGELYIAPPDFLSVKKF